jgi:hypothetical protein
MPRMPRALLALLVASAALLLLELGARLVPGASPPSNPLWTLLAPHPTRLWWMAPGKGLSAGVPVHIDANGMRLPLRDGTGPLVLTLGDSTFFGHGVADGWTLHEQLRAVLHDRGVDIRAETVAVPGYSTLQTRVAMDEYGWDLHPDLLVIGNLWSDNNFDFFEDALLLARERSGAARAERLVGHSALFRLVKRGVNTVLGRPSAMRVTWPTPASEGFRRVPIGLYTATLDGLVAEAGRRAIGAVLIAPANREILDGQFIDEWKPYFEAQRLVAEAHGLILVDSGAALRASRFPPERLFLDRMHPTAEGHGVIARALADALVAGGWPGGSRLLPKTSPAPAPPEDPYARGKAPEGHSLQYWAMEAGD